MNHDDKDGWRPRRTLSTADARVLATRAFPRGAVIEAEPLVGGLRNTSIRVVLGAHAGPVVLRLYDAEPAACAKERTLLASLASTIPSPSCSTRASTRPMACLPSWYCATSRAFPSAISRTRATCPPSRRPPPP